jgi:argininosuccinate lyase
MTEQENRLTICNRKLLEDLRATRMIGDKIADMLRTSAADWREAHAVIAQWEAARCPA